MTHQLHSKILVLRCTFFQSNEHDKSPKKKEKKNRKIIVATNAPHAKVIKCDLVKITIKNKEI